MVNKIQERTLILILNDCTSDFDTLLQNNNDTCYHQRSIQTLIVEIYKIKNNLNPLIIDFVSERRDNTYSFRNFKSLQRKEKHLKL